MATLTGGCACGEVRFEITEPLGRAVYCQLFCSGCGSASSAAARTTPR